jgi:hypothetical protein
LQGVQDPGEHSGGRCLRCQGFNIRRGHLTDASQRSNPELQSVIFKRLIVLEFIEFMLYLRLNSMMRDHRQFRDQRLHQDLFIPFYARRIKLHMQCSMAARFFGTQRLQGSGIIDLHQAGTHEGVWLVDMPQEPGMMAQVE